jgi:hypothetical protein
MRKLLFFDIDGTVLTEGQHRYVPESTKEAIRRLQENGHLCFINTGRSWSEIHDNITDLGFDGFVCGCGTYIRYHGEVLLADQIPTRLSDKVYEALHTYRLEWLLEGQHGIYYSDQPYITHIGDFHREYHALFPDRCVDYPPEKRGLVFDKFCICTHKDSDLSAFMDRFQKDFSFIDRGNGFYEVVPVGHSKATGIQFLMNYFDVPLEDTIAIGDSSNDMPMLEFAGLSIAMKKSDAIVLDTADYITDTVENDGIYKAMKHFNLV